MPELTIAELSARVFALEKELRQLKALNRGPKGEDGRDGKDGKDGRDGRTIPNAASGTATPVINIKNERPLPTTWEFDTDANGKTIARPIGLPQ